MKPNRIIGIIICMISITIFIFAEEPLLFWSVMGLVIGIIFIIFSLVPVDENCEPPDEEEFEE